MNKLQNSNFILKQQLKYKMVIGILVSKGHDIKITWEGTNLRFVDSRVWLYGIVGTRVCNICLFCNRLFNFLSMKMFVFSII